MNALHLQDKRFDLSGEFKYYALSPKKVQNSASNWVYETPQGNCYKLFGVTPTRGNVFGWKRIDGSCDMPAVWLFYYIGDFDNDGDTRFDFITVSANAQKKRVYKLLPVKPGEYFRYADLGFFNYKIEENAIEFSQGAIKYLDFKRNHKYKDLPQYQIFTNFQDAKEAGFDYLLDYSTYKLVLYKIVQTSGSNRIVFEDPQFFDGVIKIPVKIIKPAFGTADMAYYIAAFAVSKDTKKLVFDYGNSQDIVLLQQIVSCEDELQAPVCGFKQVECITTPCEPREKTYPNYCALRADSQARFLHIGACEIVKETNVSKLAASIYRFGLRLSQQLYHRQNLFISPLSIAGVMNMLYFGASNESRVQIARAFGYPPDFALAASYAALQKKLQVHNATFATANAAWVEQKFHLYKSYRYLIEDLFDASIYSANFLEKSEEMRKEINKWVTNKTQEKIKDLLPPGSVKPKTRMVLVNALYFYGKWQREFNKSKTAKEPFYIAPFGESVEADMMKAQGEFNVSQMQGFRALELPYKNEELSMWFFLPNEDFAIEELLEKLSKTSMQQIVRAKREEIDVRLKVPKFKLTWGTKNITEALQALGIEDIFDPVHADLSSLGRPIDPNANLYVGGFFHKTFIEVTEEGSEAAAATATVVTEIAGVPPVYTFYCDRPFAFMIVHNKTSTPLFMGVVNKP